MASEHPLADTGLQALDALLAAVPGSPAHAAARRQLYALFVRLGAIEWGYAELVAEQIEQNRIDGIYPRAHTAEVVVFPVPG